jgi:hypothetical protein
MRIGFPRGSCSKKEAEPDPEKWEPVCRKDHAQKRRQSMIRKSGNRFPKRSCPEKEAERDPEKWKPAFQKDQAQTTIRQSAMTIRPEVIAL